MSAIPDTPMPSATSRIAATSSGSNSGDSGRPRTTASGEASLSIRQPSAPPSRKSTNAADPLEREAAAKASMLRRSSPGGASLRYLCLRPSGGATSSSRLRPGGASSPKSAQWVCMFTTSVRTIPRTSGSVGQGPSPMPVTTPSSEVTQPSWTPRLSQRTPSAENVDIGTGDTRGDDNTCRPVGTSTAS